MNQREDTFGFYSPDTTHHKRYRDRSDAGRQLARALDRYRGRDVLVLGIPRGGVPVAAEVARALGADLDVLVARKIGAPHQKELALGAITADGTCYVNEDLLDLIDVSPEYLDETAAEEMAEAQRREARFRRGLPPLSAQNRIAILVDDGLATGATMRAAIRALRRSGVQKLVVAVPVGAPETCRRIAAEVDELVCPQQPDPFLAVGLHYAHFDQTSDDEVIELLAQQRAAASSEAGAPRGPAEPRPAR